MISLTKKKISNNIKKNLLDIKYQTYLQYHSITVITMFTYLVGFLIALITNQINTTDEWTLAITITVIFYIISFIILDKFKKELKNIYLTIENLKF